MSLLNTKTGFTTPWHCSVALMADGEWVSAPMGDFKDNPRMKVVEERGRPSYFREMAEEEYREEQRLAEQSVQVSEKAVVVEREKETSERRNENFLHWADVAYDSVDVGSGSGESLSGVDGWLRGGTTTALMVRFSVFDPPFITADSKFSGGQWFRDDYSARCPRQSSGFRYRAWRDIDEWSTSKRSISISCRRGPSA